ncbi:MAG: SpoIIE family protein phosphatase [Sedimentisphaerales bacterium]|nr:SpoIIE family protein phosphatase [Sedimentisphaerales bacterium]
MLEAREEDIDRITELFHRVLKGELPQPVALPKDYPDNEIRQLVEYTNRFAAEYRALADAMSALSRGELDFDVPAGRMHVLQSFKNLHANLRHLTWKTQQIAGGDLTQHIDFMGGFSKAFNSMTQQLKEAFERIDRQNQDLSRANQRMKSDLDAAARVQRTLLPDKFPEVEGLSFAWAYRPCDELAGDALNIVRINDDLVAVYLLDVSGHGVPAALLSVTVTRSLHPRTGDAASLVAGPAPNPQAVGPAQVAARLNSLYPMESNGEHYFTMIYGLLDIHTRRLRFTVAGHPGPILARTGEPPRRLDVYGLPIGMVDEAEYDESLIDLQPGDRLYLHSDGVTEEVNAEEEMFGDDRLLNAIADGHTLSLSDTLESLMQKVVAWRGEDHLRDDVSVLSIAVA